MSSPVLGAPFAPARPAASLRRVMGGTAKLHGGGAVPTAGTALLFTIFVVLPLGEAGMVQPLQLERLSAGLHAMVGPRQLPVRGT